MKCKMCKLDFESEEAYELHRIAHLLKEIVIDVHATTQATLTALKQAQS